MSTLQPSWNDAAMRLLAPLLLATALALPAAAQTRFKDVGDEVGVGRNLSGEECKLRLTSRGQDNVDRFGLFCGTWRQPSAILQTFKTSDRFKPEVFIVDSPWAKAYPSRIAACDDVKPATLLGVPAAYRTCRARDGGFPIVAMTARHEGSAWLVEAMPTNLAVAEAAIAVHSGTKAATDGKDGSRTAMIRAWETQYQTDAGRIAVGDQQVIADLKELLLSQVYARRLGDAEKSTRQLIDVWGRIVGPDSGALARAYADLGLVYYLMRRLDDSESALAEAEKRAKLSPAADDEGRVLAYRGGLALRLGDNEKALGYMRQSLQVRRDRKLNARSIGHSALFEMEALAQLGRYEDVIAAGNETLPMLIQGYGSIHPLVANVHYTTGDAKLRLNRPAEARADFQKTVDQRERLFGDGSRLGSALLFLAAATAREQGPAAAYPIIERAVTSTAKEPPGGLGIGTGQAGLAINTLMQVAASDPSKAKRALELAALVAQQPGGGVTSDAINKMAARLEAGDAGTGTAARALQDAVKREGEIRAAIARNLSVQDGQKSDPAGDARLQADLDKAMAEIATAERQLQAGFPRYAALVATQPARPADLGAMLKGDEALMQILPTAYGTYSIVIRAGGAVTAGASALKAEDIEGLVAGLRAGLDWQGGRERPYDLAAAHRLYVELFKPVESALSGVRHITLVQGGALQSLPLGVLLTDPPQGTGYAGQPWLARRYVLAVATSLRSFADLRRAAAKPPAPEPFIGFADPTFTAGATETRGLGDVLNACRMDAGIDPAVLRKLPRLPETADEAKAVARALGAGDTKVATGTQASEQAVTGANLGRYRVVYFATHGLLSGEARCLNEPALALTPPSSRSGRVDGLLDASEIANLKLNADWVVLSACNTAGPGGELTGDALSGLARAFFYAGARSVVASHWPVFSKPTATMMTRVFDAYGKAPAIGKAAAVREGQLLLMDQGPTAHPAVWAPFVIVGDS